MAGSKLELNWDEDFMGNPLLLVGKKKGKINLDEVCDELRYDWRHQGQYVMVLNCTEATCGVQWDGFEDSGAKGDVWELYKIEEYEKCPVCARTTPLLNYCPECGHELMQKEEAERGLRAKSREILDAIIRTKLIEAEDEEGCLRVLEGILKDALK